VSAPFFQKQKYEVPHFVVCMQVSNTLDISIAICSSEIVKSITLHDFTVF
jgi:hypothetical protein